jgi:predicted metal-dependent phosphoesterase TrpH
MNSLIDLHLHSTSSDGIHSAAELVAMAHESGLDVIAIADHDSVDAVDDALAAAAPLGITVVPAVELSVEYRHYHDVHLLGYWINHHDDRFRAMLQLFRERREQRGLRVIDRINDKLALEGRAPLDSSAVMALAEGALGRPHIARVLMQNGYADSMQDAFNSYLQPCNVPKEYLAFDDALREIKRIGGIAVLAHPQSISRNRAELTGLLGEMQAQGLDGIEVYNTMGMDGDDAFLLKLAGSLGLAVSGGSDFHGGDDGLVMGRGRGNLYLTIDLITGLKRKLPPCTIGTGRE